MKKVIYLMILLLVILLPAVDAIYAAIPEANVNKEENVEEEIKYKWTDGKTTSYMHFTISGHTITTVWYTQIGSKPAVKLDMKVIHSDFDADGKIDLRVKSNKEGTVYKVYINGDKCVRENADGTKMTYWKM